MLKNSNQVPSPQNEEGSRINELPFFLTRRELAKRIGVSTSALDRLREHAAIPSIQINRKVVLFDPVAVRAALDRFTVIPKE